MKPIIMPRSSKYGNNYWNSLGPKVDRDVTLYSDLEFDNFVRVETSWEVETYCEQYPEIPYLLDGELHTTIFDMLIKYRDGRVVYREVKYESELLSDDPRNYRTVRQIEAQRQYCLENGIIYEIMTDRSLRSSYKGLENRLKILSFVKNNPVPSVASHLIKFVRHDKLSLQALSEITSTPYPIILEACFWLFYRGEVLLNIDESILCKETEVWLRE
ncbi:TnsA endonuclease-like protein [Paenibacillus taihuensis]|uniref:TnsA endonuclease-like protein n=1 Tax=Paenibacillus taihuensis TaxID=1156355 RepID=A0A3D9QU59_9BACL|nr:TnsA endonuclease N-terminal domain-containing protein [Paenibacillus taihuensis]REE67014.1 TnsA endonuclease-like protein [Paenibacillus taihuensis]